jgi:hypothetical protein
MRNNNDLGKLISDKLNNLNQTPDDAIWNNIEADLDKKKERKFIYFSLPFLLFGILIGFLLSESEKPSLEKSSPKTNINIKDTNQKVISVKTESNTYFNDTIIKQTKEVISSSKRIIKETTKYIVFEECNTYKIAKDQRIKTNSTANLLQKNTTITNPFSNITKKENTSFIETNNQINKGNLKISKNDSIKQLMASLTNKSEKALISKAEIKNDSTLIDSTFLLTKSKKNKKEKGKQTKKKRKKNLDERYYASVFYGPSIFGTLQNGSSINSTFDNYNKAHPITSTYGFNFRTMFNKIGFRTGISVQNLSYKTELGTDLITNYSNISLNNQSTTSTIESSFTDNTDIVLKQKLTYYEIPIELYYDFTNEESKFGTSVFSGIITQYLKTNELYLSSNETKKKNIGTTKNQSKINIALDLGIGLRYKLTPKININVEPVFKYLLNPYSENTNFKPYSFSIQTGLSYKFN